MKNVQILPAFATFVVYYIIFYVLADYRIRKEISTKRFIVYSVFTCSCIIYAGIVNGIRWPLSYFIFFFALYREMIQEKKNFFTILLYVISVFFHFSTLAFVIMRLALVVKNKKMVIFAGMFTTLIPQLIMTFLVVLFTLFGELKLTLVGQQMKRGGPNRLKIVDILLLKMHSTGL